jgi:hypothetical protein
MVKNRRGATRIGCLMFMLIVAAVGYFGTNFGEAYINFLRYQDHMQGVVRFAKTTSDAQMKTDLANFADSLGLPDAARNVAVRRGTKEIVVYANYYVRVELPGFAKDVHFNPKATGQF